MVKLSSVEAWQVWLVLLIVLIVVEVLTTTLTTVWFAVGSFISCICALLGLPIWLQIIIFVAVSLTFFIFLRPILIEKFQANRVKTNVEAMEGKRAVVTERINNLNATGCVKVNGVEWKARTTDDFKTFEVGTVVTIKSVDGVTVIIEA